MPSPATHAAGRAPRRRAHRALPSLWVWLTSWRRPAPAGVAPERQRADHVGDEARDSVHAALLAAVEGSGSEILLVDPTTLSIAYANAGARANLQGDPLARRLTEIIELPESELRALLQAAEGARDHRARWQQVRCDGSSYAIESTITRMAAPPAPGMLLIVGLDVQERSTREQSMADSEARYRAVLDASQDGIWDLDLVRGRVFMSAQALQITGMSVPAALRGEMPFDAEQLLNLIHPDDRTSLLELATAYAERRAAQFDSEFRLQSDAGVYRWLRARGSACWDASGMPVRLTLCLSDVTQRRIAESILRDTVSRLAAVLEHVADGIVTFDAQGQVRSFNPAAERIFGFSEEEMLDESITRIVPLPEALRSESWDTAYARLQAGGATEGVHRDGAVLPVEIAVTPLVAAGHELFTAVVRDVSDRRRAESELRAARDAARASLRAKTEFLAVMSHEIRTPLNGVLGMAQLLLDSRLSSDQSETVRMIQRSGDALLSIINDVLDFSKIEAGRMQLESAPFDLRRLIREVFELLAAPAREAGIELVLDYPLALPRVLLGDSARVRQVLVNLIGNAVKFTARGHVAVSVRARGVEPMAEPMAELQADPEADPEGDLPAPGLRFAIAVEDSGIGIEPAVQDRLFTAFTQADASTTRRFGGTGLGLAISRQLCALMDGELSLQSVPGVGSVFTIVLPFGLPVACAPALPASPTAVLCSIASRQVRMLVPYPRVRDVLVAAFNELGSRVRCCASLEALLATEGGSLVVLDRCVLDGATADVGGQLQARGIDCILLVPSASDAERSALLAQGYHAVLAKPVGVDELATALQGERRAHKIASAGPIRAGAPLRVLVADDNAVNQRVAMRMLERLGCAVLLADDGQAAIDCWRDEPLDLVLMDVRMPVLDGLAATMRIRAEEHAQGRARMPVVAISANASPEDELRCRAAGMDGFVAKPIRLHALAQVIAAHVDVAARH